MPANPLHDLLRYHVSGAIERGEGEAVVGVTSNRDLMMANGAKVSDWIGTARVAASVAASALYDAERNDDASVESSLRYAADMAAQSLDEIAHVMDRLGYAHGYGTACTFGDPS